MPYDLVSMTSASRYDVSGLIETQYQSGSRDRVLRNLPGITSKREMDDAEAREQNCIYHLAKVTKRVTLAKRYINGWKICMDKNSYLS